MTALRIGELFAGYGGLGQGVQSVLGGDIAWVSEIDPGACKILAHRFPGIPNHGDITAIDWAAVEPVDVLTGGFPCQDVSAAGKRAGVRPGTRSGLWSEMVRAIDALRPSLVVIENVRGLLSATAEHPAHSDLEPCPWCLGDDEPVTLRALGAVLGDLADCGFDASWVGLRAADVGAPHGRFRVFVTAWPVADAERGGRDGGAGTPGSSRRAEPADRGVTVADSDDAADDREWSRPGSAVRADSDAARVGRGPSGRDDGVRPAGLVAVDWGAYGDAIQRWERCVTRPAPSPTELSRKGSPRLSPAFVEWMMGLPAGWVTDVPGLGRNEQLKALGNGVVPQQAAHALRLLLPDVAVAA